MELRGRTLLTTFGGVAIAYSIVVLGFVVTSPDLRLRCLMVDDVTQRAGLQVRATPGLATSGETIEPGDLLTQIGEHPTTNFFDFSRVLSSLHNAQTPPGGLLDAGADPSELSKLGLPWLVEENQIGRRWVQVQFLRHGTTPTTTWVLLQSVPAGDVLLTFVWLLFQLGICGVAALAWWHRPFDRAARLFFVMGIVTLGAFLGGYHWHLIAGNLWLSLPLIVFIALLPAVTLHFFLVYPRPKMFVQRHPRVVASLLYGPPAAAVVGAAILMLRARFLSLGTSSEVRAEHIEHALNLLRSGIYVYLAIGAASFATTLGVLIDSFLTTRNPIEQNQVKWILWASAVAAALVACTLTVAWFDRVEFALGQARILFFLASVSLMLAYAVAIVRHKLMLLDQIVGKGVWYWVVSSGLTLAVSLSIAASSLLDQVLKITLSLQQSITAFAVLTLAVALLLWLRDFGQQTIDRRFFREKYQLDRTLQRMNQAIGYLGDQESLAQMMLGSCGDVLRVDRSALYIRSADGDVYRLIAARGGTDQPLEFTMEESLLAALQEQGSIQRVEVNTRSEMTSVQNGLRELRADLVHAIDSGEGVVGLVILGEKKAGGGYSAEDLTYLHALSQITHVALQTARVREDLARMNDDLHRKTERLTNQDLQISILQAELTAASMPADKGDDETPPDDDAAAAFRRDAMRGNSPAVLRILETARKVASSESTVLIRGESGTGKEVLAQVLHENSPRRDGPMVRVHCAALSPGLLESELFGHVKGAFTGAHKDRVGRFEAANKGTLFLDEIGDISLETQVKLLRVLQERSFEPVGGSRTVGVDVRLVTATHQDLTKLIAQGRFREDLYYRLNVISMTLPPLRDRPEDVLELSLFFLARAASKLSKRVTHIDAEALRALETHRWPGNIRELENVIERAVVLCDGNAVTLKELPVEVRTAPGEWPRQVIEAKPLPGSAIALPESAFAGRMVAPSAVRAPEPAEEASDERAAILDALKKCQGNKARAARVLGVPRSTLFSRMKKHGIE